MRRPWQKTQLPWPKNLRPRTKNCANGQKYEANGHNEEEIVVITDTVNTVVEDQTNEVEKKIAEGQPQDQTKISFLIKENRL